MCVDGERWDVRRAGLEEGEGGCVLGKKGEEKPWGGEGKTEDEGTGGRSGEVCVGFNRGVEGTKGGRSRICG